jgi:hypothetical protein
VLRTNQGSKAILVLKNEVFLNQGLFLRNKRYRQGNEKGKVSKKSRAFFFYLISVLQMHRTKYIFIKIKMRLKLFLRTLYHTLFF